MILQKVVCSICTVTQRGFSIPTVPLPRQFCMFEFHRPSNHRMIGYQQDLIEILNEKKIRIENLNENLKKVLPKILIFDEVLDEVFDSQ